MFPALVGKPSAFMSSMLEFRLPLLVSQLEHPLVCCVWFLIMPRMVNLKWNRCWDGNASGGLQHKIKRLWLIEHNKMRVERGSDDLWVFRERCQCFVRSKITPSYSSVWTILAEEQIDVYEKWTHLHWRTGFLMVSEVISLSGDERPKILGWDKKELHCFMKSDWRGWFAKAKTSCSDHKWIWS